jgi:phosphoglycerol transferase MdoB-like AlkP superfamily enzyme
MGVTNDSPMIGRDLNNTQVKGRAMMQYADNFAYMTDENVTILQPQKPPVNFDYSLKKKKKKLEPKAINAKLAEIALAHALWGSLAYENQWYSSKTE